MYYLPTLFSFTCFFFHVLHVHTIFINIFAHNENLPSAHLIVRIQKTFSYFCILVNHNLILLNILCLNTLLQSILSTIPLLKSRIMIHSRIYQSYTYSYNRPRRSSLSIKAYFKLICVSNFITSYLISEEPTTYAFTSEYNLSIAQVYIRNI